MQKHFPSSQLHQKKTSTSRQPTLKSDSVKPEEKKYNHGQKLEAKIDIETADYNACVAKNNTETERTQRAQGNQWTLSTQEILNNKHKISLCAAQQKLRRMTYLYLQFFSDNCTFANNFWATNNDGKQKSFHNSILNEAKLIGNNQFHKRITLCIERYNNMCKSNKEDTETVNNSRIQAKKLATTAHCEAIDINVKVSSENILNQIKIVEGEKEVVDQDKKKK